MYFLDSVYILFIQIKKVISSYQANHNPAFHLANSAFYTSFTYPKIVRSGSELLYHPKPALPKKLPSKLPNTNDRKWHLAARQPRSTGENERKAVVNVAINRVGSTAANFFLIALLALLHPVGLKFSSNFRLILSTN